MCYIYIENKLTRMEPKENKTLKTWVRPEVIIIAYNDIENGVHPSLHEGTLVPTVGGQLESQGGGLFQPSLISFVHS
jgi:hypothetical protein